MRFVGCLGIGLLVAGLAACGGGNANTGTTTAANSDTTTTSADDATFGDLREHHAHHHGGFIHFVIMSVETVGGTPEQKEKIEAVRKDLLAKTAPVHEANKNLISVMADVLADGDASPDDNKKLDAAVAQLAAAAAAAHGASTQALNQLHGVLDAAQRQTVADKVEAHWQMWRQSNHTDDKDNSGMADAEEHHVKRLTKTLDLSADQVEKMKAALKTGMANLPGRLDPAEVDAHVKAFGEAFTKDTFDAASLHGENVASHLAGAGAARMARFYATIAPMLTVDQRTKLSEHFKKHQNKGPELPSSN